MKTTRINHAYCEGVTIKLSSMPSEITKVFPKATSKSKKIIIRGISLLADIDGLIYKSYEEALYVLLYGKLPTQNELDILNNKIKESFNTEFAEIFHLLANYKLVRQPLTLIQILTLMISYKKETDDVSIISNAFKYTCYLFNAYFNKPIVHPRKDLGLIENLLFMIGKDYKDPLLIKHFSSMMIAWMDIGTAPSSIATRVNASSRANTISSIVAGIGNASGIKHTSARIGAMKLLFEVKSLCEKNGLFFPINSQKDRKEAQIIIQNLIQAKTDRGNLIPGFGHYIFKGLDDNGIDPRISVVESAIEAVYPENTMIHVANMLREVFRSEKLTRRGKTFVLPPNSDIYWAAFLSSFLEDYGNPVEVAEIASLFTILTRMSGLLAHNTEQRKEHAAMRIPGWVSDLNDSQATSFDHLKLAYNNIMQYISGLIIKNKQLKMLFQYITKHFIQFRNKVLSHPTTSRLYEPSINK